MSPNISDIFHQSRNRMGSITTPNVIPTVGENKVITDMPTSKTWTKPPLVARGIKPSSPTIYFDIDTKYLEEEEKSIINKEIREKLKGLFDKLTISQNQDLNYINESIPNIYQKIISYINYQEAKLFYSKLVHTHWATYMTKDGYHYVQQMPTWDRVQYSLYELKYIFPRSNYILNCRKLRLRISAKWDKLKVDNFNQPLVVSHEPILYEHCTCPIWSTYHNPDWDIRGEINNEAQLEMYNTYD